MPAKKKTTAKRKTTAKKTTAKKTTVKKTTAKKTAAARKMSAVKDPFTKTQLLNEIADSTELTKKEVQSVLDELATIIERHIKRRGPGAFTMPGLFKIVVNKRPAKKARKGINPFTGEPTIFKAKPAQNVVKIRPLKKMKEMAA